MMRAYLLTGIIGLLCLVQAVAVNSLVATITYASTADTTITIRAVTGLQYDIVRFAVKPGTRVKIMLENADDMAHNLVVTKPGKRLDVVKAALALDNKGPALDYVPKSTDVLGAIRVLSPSQQGELVWTAPEKEGVYPYVCTYPGHGFVMYGALYVTTKPLPPLKKDTHIPQQAIEEETPVAHHVDYTDRRPSPHPYPVTLPMLYRTFMPESGPASIVVVLPNEQSYCWDAGTCRLRYAWQGYVDNSEHWHGNGKRISKVVGDVYYREKGGFPFRLGHPEQVPKEVQFKGYQLVDKYPHFRYTMDGVEVIEVIRALDQDNGLVREFRVGPVSEVLFFSVDQAENIEYTASAGVFQSNILRLTPEQAKRFTITMRPKKVEKL